MASSQNNKADIRESLRAAIEHLEHVLPGQFPLEDFVHHNTLHGYQHMEFPDALAATHEKTGIYGYLPEDEFRKLFKLGRITRKELAQVISDDSQLDAGDTIFSINDRIVSKLDVVLCGLVYPVKMLTACQLNWQIEELDVLQHFQEDVSDENREAVMQSSKYDTESEVISDLWSSCLGVLGLEHFILHPEDLMDLSPVQAESIMATYTESTEADDSEKSKVIQHMIRDAEALLRMLFKRVGNDLTFRGVLKSITGVDIMDSIRPVLVRHLSNFMDQGVAAWHNQDRVEGFFASWKHSASKDLAWSFDDVSDWPDVLGAIPEDPLDAVISELKLMGIPENRWDDYLQQLALELPGWSGMFMWRQQRPEYKGLEARIDMTDYLAVRLVLERMFAQQLCRQTWNIAPNLYLLQWYFRANKAEFLVRYALFNLRLPEYIVSRAHLMVRRHGQNAPDIGEWRYLAQIIWTWRQSSVADSAKGHSVYRSGWRLFRMAQHLGLSGDVVRKLSVEQVESILHCIDQLTPDKTGFLWLQAYENHYRDRLFNAVQANHGRGRWKMRAKRPDAQVVFCMDDREEGLRRHLEEHNPSIETLGAAGFFGVAINWKALDDKVTSALCPVVVSPSHEVHEIADDGSVNIKELHDSRRSLRLGLKNFLFNDTRHRLLLSTVGTILVAPVMLISLIGKVFIPLKAFKVVRRLRYAFEPEVPTSLLITAKDDGSEATPDNNRIGFTDVEQADRVQNFLRTIGLASGFSPLVVMMGHGSSSQNNPHLAAYDCGACSGKHGGPNARAFAAIANRPEIRALLRERGLDIPDDTWFLGALHNTCDETYEWYDLDKAPDDFAPAIVKLQDDLEYAGLCSAHERCRKFASAPDHPDYKKALKHIRERMADFSQARPELGHATNAAAFIGRRSLSQGAFFDRRVFLISYDPSIDPDGAIIENILLNAGPVGAGINLEYYFSTVNNNQYGCSSKITHNINGMFGVMEGTESDLRTGLPKQMIEVHEGMRLQVLVEARIGTLTEIYQRQPALQELVGNGWLLLSAKDPDSAEIHCFDPSQGWVLWHGETSPLDTVEQSMDWYDGHMEPLSPALIRQPVEAAHV